MATPWDASGAVRRLSERDRAEASPSSPRSRPAACRHWLLATLLQGVACGANAGLRLVGVGFPSTGTQSMRFALRHLGYNAVHGEFFWINTTMRRLWIDHVHRGGPLEPALQSVLEQGYDTTLDMPTVLAWRDLVSRFPDAKVIMTIRDSPETWYKSISSKAHHPPRMLDLLLRYIGWYHSLDLDGYRAFLKMNQHKYDCDFQAVQTQELRERCTRRYIEHMDEVRRVIPADRLLVFNVKEGWGPLCEFLGVPVPDIPFPHRDITKSGPSMSNMIEDIFDEKIGMNLRPLLWFVPIILAPPLCCIWILLRCCGFSSAKRSSEGIKTD